LLSGEKFGCSQEILTIIAMLQVQNVFQTPSGRKIQADKSKLKFASAEGDHITWLNVFKSYNLKMRECGKSSSQLSQWCHVNYLNFKSLQRATQIRNQLTALMRKFKCKIDSSSGDRAEPVLKCLTYSFFTNVAKAHYSGEGYQHLKSDTLFKVHPSSVINLYLANVDAPPPKFIIYNDIVQSKTTYLIRDISVIDYKWLNELLPDYFDFGTEREIYNAQSFEKKIKLL
jgi:ATP-dependent RNA helicase DDX35